MEKVSKYEKNNTIHNGCWRSGPEVFLVRILARKISGVQSRIEDPSRDRARGESGNGCSGLTQ